MYLIPTNSFQVITLLKPASVSIAVCDLEHPCGQQIPSTLEVLGIRHLEDQRDGVLYRYVRYLDWY